MSGFKQVQDYGVVKARKDNEFIVVQTVTTGAQPWREARINYTDKVTGDLRGTKSAVDFDSVEALTTFIEALEEMRDDWAAEAATQPTVAPKVQVRKPKNISARAKAVARKGQAANAS